jgi:hypothetical protein
MKTILDPSFSYTPSSTTDLRKTFARLRREQRLDSQQTGREANAARNDEVLAHRSIDASSKKGGTP